MLSLGIMPLILMQILGFVCVLALFVVIRRKTCTNTLFAVIGHNINTLVPTYLRSCVCVCVSVCACVMLYASDWLVGLIDELACDWLARCREPAATACR